MSDLVLLALIIAGIAIFLAAVPWVMTRGRGNKWTDNGTIDFQKFNRENSRKWVLGGMRDQTRPLFSRTTSAQNHRISDQNSGQRLVDAIALRHPLVLFMSGSKTTPTPDETTLLDIFKTLELRPYLASTSADPLIKLAIPAPNDAHSTALPYLYVGGQPFGGVSTVLQAIQDGSLTTALEKSRIIYDKTVAKALQP